ncbi:homoserine kinase [Schaalia sp. lx-260]|uniref:homoserine kinase n=1 Tax=Schaalia sp. lx-260 TaxID=2899082 RepID=UPI001E57EA4E|nr:homoserine kinase [Schaalia sp. lx-260]MCD4549658.1 homoserine kinase [Schaalia sp. lx-260]
MQLRNDFVAVQVPATTANMGPGFDSMGMALDVWDDVSVHATSGPTEVVIEGEGAGTVETGEDNLIVRALRFTLDRMGAPQVGIRMRCMNRIAHSRGLGSSAAAIVAGCGLARALVGDPEALTEADMLDIATELEGHPDNVAPALYGGATIAWMENGRPGMVSVGVPQRLQPVVFIPDFELSTSRARAALPATVPHGDASYNVSRAALLTALLGTNLVASASGGRMSPDFHELLMIATDDRLHQEQRRSNMEPSLALVDWLRAAGIAAVVSGAGPTVISLESVPAKICSDARAAGWHVVNVGIPHRGLTVTRGQLKSTSHER